MESQQVAMSKVLKKRKQFMMNCLCKNDSAFKKYFDKIKDDNKKAEKKLNDKLMAITKKMDDQYKKETKGLKSNQEKINVSIKIALENEKKINKIIDDKINYGLKSGEKLIKSRIYKSALKKSSKVCHSRILKYKQEIDKNMDMVYQLLEFYKQERKSKRNPQIEKYYTKIVKIIDLLEYEHKMLKSVLE